MPRSKKSENEAQPPGEGHNGLSPDRIVELTLEARRMKRALDEASGKHRAVLSKLSEGGVDMRAWRQVEALHKLDDDEREVRMNNVARYAGFLSLSLGAQPGLFSSDDANPTTKTREAVQAALAEDDGYAAGRSGSARDTNPKEAGTPHHVLWDKGWKAGEAAAIEAMKTGESKVRGRQKPSGNPEDAPPVH